MVWYYINTDYIHWRKKEDKMYIGEKGNMFGLNRQSKDATEGQNMHLMVHTRGEPMNDNINPKELEDFSLILGGTLKKYEKQQLNVAELWILDDMRKLKQKIDAHLKIVK